MTTSHGGPPVPPCPARRWYDADAGPLVRPYAITGGRTRPGAPTVRLDLIALVVPAGDAPSTRTDDAVLGPEHGALLELCRTDLRSVADLAAEADLPVGVVRVLVGDLLDAGLVRVTRPAPAAQLPDAHLLREVIHGLRAL
ncbi:hypothetical protein BJP40_06130 [Streptomyces sp. CC53]|uniref:DUF742 domain-containing protein n=1 Tax=unclassified Streptomyces TaxID=2593676 RepID=UPI0008DDBE66|nr:MULTISPECIES: DUF742 domain-containing protein [unclassified Streptomyces]OII61294.1 hypothetical protein BJP40_06130 [Streptomyces sp. CC53]